MDPAEQATRYRRIWAAVLQLAVGEALGTMYCTAYQQREARKWVRDTKTNLGSFTWICRLLDVEPEKARTAILKRKFQKAAKPPEKREPTGRPVGRPRNSPSISLSEGVT